MPWAALLVVWKFARGLPWQVWAALGAALLCWWLYAYGASVGAERERQKVEDAMKADKERADRAQVGVDECFARGEPWVWDRGTSTCVKR